MFAVYGNCGGMSYEVNAQQTQGLIYLNSVTRSDTVSYPIGEDGVGHYFEVEATMWGARAKRVQISFCDYRNTCSPFRPANPNY